MLDILRMAANLRQVSGQTEAELPNVSSDPKITGAFEYLNKAYWKILDEFDFRQKERTTYFDTVIGVEAYDLPVAYEAVQNVAIYNDSYNSRIPLVPLSRPTFDATYNDNVNYRAAPTGYMREQDAIRLQPIPDAVYRVYIYYWTTLLDLADPSNDIPEIPRAWHEIIELGGKYRLLFDIGDREGGILFKQMYDREIATLKPQKAKEMADHSLSGLEVLGRSYD